MIVAELLRKMNDNGFINTSLGEDNFEYIVELIKRDLSEDKLTYVVNCPGCGRSVTGNVPIPAKDGSVETICSNCEYLLASYEYEEVKTGNDTL